MDIIEASLRPGKLGGQNEVKGTAAPFTNANGELLEVGSRVVMCPAKRWQGVGTINSIHENSTTCAVKWDSGRLDRSLLLADLLIKKTGGTTPATTPAKAGESGSAAAATPTVLQTPSSTDKSYDADLLTPERTPPLPRHSVPSPAPATTSEPKPATPSLYDLTTMPTKPPLSAPPPVESKPLPKLETKPPPESNPPPKSAAQEPAAKKGGGNSMLIPVVGIVALFAVLVAVQVIKPKK